MSSWVITPIIWIWAFPQTGFPGAFASQEIRQSLGWDVVPVVRNRQRALFFGERGDPRGFV